MLRRPDTKVKDGNTVPEGNRNSRLSSLAGGMRRQDATMDSILAALHAENANRCNPPLPDDELRKIAESVAHYEPSPDKPIDFAPMTLSELMERDLSIEYLIEHILAARQPILFAGPVKSLKTSLLLDLLLSLATGTPFLNRLEVVRKFTVGVFTGESGLPTIRDTLYRIARRRRNVDLATIDNLIVSDRIPRLSKENHLDAIRQIICERKLELLAVDPAYLALDGSEASNVMSFGQQLHCVSELCQKHGVALLLCHHTKKGSGSDCLPLQLTDIAWAGFAEHCRQWILVNHRQRYEPGSGLHHLWLTIGGSAGQGGRWAVDVNEGHLTDPGGRRWKVTVATPDEAMLAAANKRTEQDTEKIIQAMTALQKSRPEGNSKTSIRDKSKLKGQRFTDALDLLLENGKIVECLIQVSNQKTPRAGYKLAENDED